MHDEKFQCVASHMIVTPPPTSTYTTTVVLHHRHGWLVLVIRQLDILKILLPQKYFSVHFGVKHSTAEAPRIIIPRRGV